MNVTLALASNNLAFRGHREKVGEPIRGNFLALIELLAKYDPILDKLLQQPDGSPVTKPKYICRSHFAADAFQEVQACKLTIWSVPTLNPGVSGSTLASTSSSNTLPHHLPKSSDPVCSIPISPKFDEKSPASPVPINHPEILPVTPKTSVQCTGILNVTPSPQKITTPPTNCRTLLKEINATRISQLTPRKKLLLDAHKKRQKEIMRLRKEFKALKKKTVSKVIDLHIFKNLPDALKLLLKSTLSQSQSTHSNGGAT